ncbi:hypothetical protein [Fulvivirga sedimenti]|uniref:Uncharacterized protein n=1 Tax=Fulvivirga sedimenti TaxID=2879465 RepID=A0A9X1HXG8_9BACT|nr:hypothetical protein [Fulvivirga sedimenti]MCA6079135.1 hypothetical protein [Fulvivirga sedimenti]
MRRTFPPTSVIPAVLHEAPGYAGDIQGVGRGPLSVANPILFMPKGQMMGKVVTILFNATQ